MSKFKFQKMKMKNDGKEPKVNPRLRSIENEERKREAISNKIFKNQLKSIILNELTFRKYN